MFIRSVPTCVTVYVCVCMSSLSLLQFIFYYPLYHCVVLSVLCAFVTLNKRLLTYLLTYQSKTKPLDISLPNLEVDST